MRDEAVALDMPNGIEAKVNYKQEFIHAPHPNKAGPTNSAAKMVDHSKVMRQVMEGK